MAAGCHHTQGEERKAQTISRYLSNIDDILCKIKLFSTQRSLDDSSLELETVMSSTRMPGPHQKYCPFFLRLCIRFQNKSSSESLCLAKVLPYRYERFICSLPRYWLSDAKHMERKWWETRFNPRRLSGRVAGRSAVGTHVGGLHTSRIWRGAALCSSAVHKPSIGVISRQRNARSR